jgi:hypothetical protein
MDIRYRAITLGGWAGGLLGGMARDVRYYRGIRGSAALATAPLDAGGVAAETLEAGEMRRLPFDGELLGAVRVRARFAPIPLDAFDRACARLEAEEQAAWLHLLRLSIGEGRNWCRAAKRDLMDRLRLSERRLLRVLDALVAKGFARPLHRDNRGTLWRVALPCEALGEPAGDDVLLGRAAPAPVPALAPRRPVPAAASPAASAPTAASASAPRALRGGGAEPLARALAAARGDEAPAALARARAEVEELLAEGMIPARIAAAIGAVRRRAAGAAGEGT